METPESSSLPVTTEISPEQRLWAMFGHLSALAGYVLPFGNILGPLIVWQMKKTDMPQAAAEAREALNFQITVTIAGIACMALFFLIIPVFLAIAIWFGALIMSVIAGVKANDGKVYRYPFTWRLVN